MARVDNGIIKGGDTRGADKGPQIGTGDGSVPSINLPDINVTESSQSSNQSSTPAAPSLPEQLQRWQQSQQGSSQSSSMQSSARSSEQAQQSESRQSFARPSSLISGDGSVAERSSSSTSPVASIATSGNEPASGAGDDTAGMSSSEVDAANANELANNRAKIINTSRGRTSDIAPRPLSEDYSREEPIRNTVVSAAQSSATSAATPTSNVEQVSSVKPDKPQVRVTREKARKRLMPRRFLSSETRRRKNVKNTFGSRGKAKGNTISSVMGSSANIGINEASIGSIEMMEAFRQKNSVVNRWVRAYLEANGSTDQYLQGNAIIDEDAFQDMLVAAFADGRVAQLTKTPIEEGSIHSVIVKVHRGDGLIMHPIVAPIFNADNDGDAATISFASSTAFTKYRGNENAVPGKMNTDLIVSTDGVFKLDPDFWQQNPWGKTVADTESTVKLVLKKAGVKSPVQVKQIAKAVYTLASKPGDKTALESIMRGLNANAIHVARGNERIRAAIAADLIQIFYDFNSFSPDVTKAYVDVALAVDDIFKKAEIKDAYHFEDDFVALSLEQGTMPANYYDILVARGMYAGFAGGNTYFRMFGGLAKTANHDKRTVVTSEDAELDEALQWVNENCRDATHDEIYSLMLQNATSNGLSFSKTRLRRDSVLVTVGLPSRYESFEQWRDALITEFEFRDKQAEIAMQVVYIDGRVEKTYTAKPIVKNGKIDNDAFRDAVMTVYGDMPIQRFLGEEEFEAFSRNLDKTTPMPAGWQYMTLNELANGSWWTSASEGVVYISLHGYMKELMEKHTGDMHNFNNSFNKACDGFRKSKNPNLAQATVLMSEDVFMSYNIQSEEVFEKSWIGKALKSGTDVKNVVYTATADILTLKLRDALKSKNSIAVKAELEYLKGLSPVWKTLALDFEDRGKSWSEVKPEESKHNTAIDYLLDINVDHTSKEELIGKLVSASGLLPTNKWSNDFFSYNLMVKPGADAVYKTDADYMQKNWREASSLLKREPKSREVSREVAQELASQVAASVTDYLSGKANPFTRISRTLVADAVVALGEGRYSLSEKGNQLSVVDALYSSLCQRALGGLYSDLSIFANKGSISLEIARKSPEIMARIWFDPEFNPIVYDEYGRTVEYSKHNVDELADMIEADPSIADFFAAHEFVPQVDEKGNEGDPQYVRTSIKDTDGKTPFTRPYRSFERYADHPSFYFLVSIFSGDTAGKTAAQQRKETLAGIDAASDFVDAVKSGHISQKQAIDRILKQVPSEILDGIWVAEDGKEYDVETEIKKMFDSLFEKDPSISWPTGKRTPSVKKMDAQTIYKSFNAMQAMSSAKTNVSTGVNGDETRRYAMLAFLANHVTPGGASNAMEIPRTSDWQQTSEYQGWVEANTGLTIREDTIDEINRTLLAAGIQSMRLFNPGDNANPVGPDAAHAVGDNSFTIRTNQQSSALGRLMTTLRALGTEAFNLKVKKKGDDGTDSVIKFDPDKVFGTSADHEFLRSLESMDLVSARNAYAEYLQRQFSDPNYVSNYDMFTRGDFENIASWCVTADVEGNVHFRSIGQLNAAITNYAWQYYQLTDGELDHQSIQDYLMDRLIDDSYESSDIRLEDELVKAPAGEPYRAMVSFRDSSSSRRTLTALRFMRENQGISQDLIGDGYTEYTDVEAAEKRGNIFVGEAAENYPGAILRQDGQWQVNFFTTKMNQLNMPDPQSRFSAGEFTYLPSEIKCLALDNTGIEQLADAEVVGTQYEQDHAMFSHRGNEVIRVADLFRNFFDKHVSDKDDPKVSLLSRDEVIYLFNHEQGPIVWDASVYGSSATQTAIEEFALQIESNNFVDSDSSAAYLTETHPGRVIGVAKCESGVGADKRVCYAPIMAYDEAKGGNAPYYLTVEDLSIDTVSGDINIDWSFSGSLRDGSAKMLQDMAAFDKFMTKRGGLDLDPDRRNAAGLPINFIVNENSVMSRMKGMLQNHCMNSAMWFARSVGYNFAEVEGAFPDNPEFREKVRSGLATKQDWRNALDEGMLFFNEEPDLAGSGKPSINDFCRFIVEKSLAYNVNPEWFFVSEIDGKQVCMGTDWMIYTSSAPAMKDAWFHFFHTVNEKFCPDVPGVETDESGYYWDSDWKFESKHPYIDARTGEKMVATTREYHFYGRHSYDDHYTGFKTPGRTKPKSSSLTGEITKLWSGKIPDEEVISAIFEYRFGKQNPLFGMDDASYGLEIVSDTSELAAPKQVSGNVFPTEADLSSEGSFAKTPIRRAGDIDQLSQQAAAVYGNKDTVIIAVTGHRPKQIDGKLHNKYAVSDWEPMIENYEQAFEKAILENPGRTIVVRTGGALGVDQAAAIAAERIKKVYPGRLLHELCLPYGADVESAIIKQSSTWKNQSTNGQFGKILLTSLAKYADVVTLTTKVDSLRHDKSGNYKKRNHYMANGADILLAGVGNGGLEEDSGTAETVTYFKKLPNEGVYAFIYADDMEIDAIDSSQQSKVSEEVSVESIRFSSKSGDTSWLSNMALYLDSGAEMAAESIYQSSKIHGIADHFGFDVFRLPTDIKYMNPYKAKRLGGKKGALYDRLKENGISQEEVNEYINKNRDDWMAEAISEKFLPNTELAQKLVDTYPAHLIEDADNTHDFYWGQDSTGRGENRLGQILEARRDELMSKYGMRPQSVNEVVKEIEGNESLNIVNEVPTEGNKQAPASVSTEVKQDAVTTPIVDKLLSARADYTPTDVADSVVASASRDIDEAAAISGTGSAAFRQAVSNAKQAVEAASGKTTRESDVSDLEREIANAEAEPTPPPEGAEFLADTESEQLQRAHDTINMINKQFYSGYAFNYPIHDVVDERTGELVPSREEWERPAPVAEIDKTNREKVERTEEDLFQWLMAGSQYENITGKSRKQMKRQIIDQLIMCYYSYSVDSNGLILNSEGEGAKWAAKQGEGATFDISDQDRLRACQDMLSNFKRYGYFSRCEMVKNERMKAFGLERVSIPIPAQLARQIFNSNLKAKWDSIDEFNAEGQQMWSEYCEYMSQNPDEWFTASEGTYGIGRAWGPYMMNAALNGATDEELVSMGLVSVEPFIDWFGDTIGINEDGREASEAVKANVAAARERMAKEKGTLSDTDNLRATRDANKRAKKFEAKTLKRMAKFVQINKMLGITVWLPATAESALGTSSEALLTDMMYRQAGANRLSKDFYKTLDQNKAAIEMMAGLVDAMNAGTWDEIVTRANNRGLQAYDMSLKDYVNQEKARNNGKGGVNARIDYALNKGGNVAVRLASGSSVAKNFNAHRIMDMAYLWMRAEAVKNGGDLTVEEFQNQVLANPEKFINGLAQTGIGREAVLFAAQSVVGGANVVNYRWNKLMAKHPAIDACLTLFVHTFHRYGIAMAQNIVPYSHTIQYLMAQRRKGDAADGASNYAYDHITLSQMITYDSILLGFKSAPLLIVTGLFMALGIEPPDDEDKINTYGEWKIGGVPLSDSWMFRDLFGLISPLVVASYGAAHGADFQKLLLDGASGVIQGLPWEDLSTVVGYIANFDHDLLMNEEELDYNWDVNANSPEYWMTKAGATALRTVGKWFDNPVVSSFYRGTFIPGQTELAHSASQVYAYDENGNKVTTRTDWADSQIRKVTRNSYSAALMMNAAAMIKGATDGTDERPFTGYLNGQMPLITVIDPAQAALADYLDITVGMTEEEQREKVLQSLSILNSFDSAEEAAQNGLVIPYATRQMMYEYLMDQIDYLETDFGNRKAAGEFYGDYNAQNEAYKLMKARVDWCYEMKERIYGNAIPYSPTKYNQWVTNYNTYYTNKETGESATWWDYMLDNEGIEQHLYAVGDHKSANAPLDIVDTRYGTYDQQTPVGWQGDLTDIDKVRSLYNDITINGGWHDGEKAMDLLTGYGNSEKTLLFGDRSFIPVGQEYGETFKLTDPDDLKNAWHPFTDGTISIDPETGEIVGGDGTKQVDSSSNDNNGYPSGYYPRSYSSGGGSGSRSYGGSSSPNIYSRASSGGINAPRAATMYSKTPSYTRFSYLSPKFETKGSREAYKRQDI